MITFITISVLQLLIVIVFGVFFGTIPHILTCLAVTLISLVFWIISYRKLRGRLLFAIGLVVAAIGVALLLLPQAQNIYLGYGVSILGQVFISVFLNRQPERKAIWIYLLALAFAILIGQLMGLVIMVGTFNFAMSLMMLLVSMMITNLIFLIGNRASPIVSLSHFLLMTALLFTGLKVIAGGFAPNSVLSFIINVPWHIGVFIFACHHICFHYELVKNRLA